MSENNPNDTDKANPGIDFPGGKALFFTTLATVIAGLVTVFGTILSEASQAYWTARLEDKRFQAKLIDGALESEDERERIKSLLFLADTNLIFDRRIRDGIRKSIADENVPSTPISFARQGATTVTIPAETGTIPPEFVGIDGAFDSNGLSKRVSQEFDAAGISGIEVRQDGSTVVLQYSSDAEDDIERAKALASDVDGTSNVIAEPTY